MTGAELGPPRGPVVAYAEGIVVEWHESGWPRFEHGVPQVFATREIVGVPSSDELSSAGDLPAWRVMRAAAGQMVATAGFMPGCDSLELRYVATPGTKQARVRMFITAKARAWRPDAAEAAVEAACSALPPGFSSSAPEDPPQFGQERLESTELLELRRHEEVTYPQWEYVPADFYYTINDDPGDGSGWGPFWTVLSHVTSPVTVSLLLKGTDLDEVERNVLGSVTTGLAIYGEAHSEYDAFYNEYQVHADTNARVARDSWLQRMSQLQRPLLARVAVEGGLQDAVPVATSLAAAIAADHNSSDSHPMYIEPANTDADRRQARYSMDWLEILPWGGHGIWQHELAPNSLRRMPYLYGVNQAGSLAILPVPDERGTPGFVLSRRIEARRAAVRDETAEDRILLGEALHLGHAAGKLRLPLSAVVRHTLVVGSPGSGKTTTVLNLATRLWNEHRIPFLAIEPVKHEYRSLLETPGLEGVRVHVLGRDDISPLRLNPLEPPQGVRREVHVSNVMASLKMAVPLFAPLPQLLAAALDLAYERAGWEEATTTADGLVPPTLRDLLTCFEEEFERAHYVGEARNIVAAGRVRLESLLRGSQGRLLDTVESTDFDELLAQPVVVELDEIADPDDKAIVAAFILDRIRAGARRRGPTRGKLRHVTIVEEAHRLLSRSDGARQGADGEDPRAQSVRAFSEAVTELRAQGEGFILSTQFPAQLADAAVAAAGTRILHRLERADDRDVVLNDIDASDADRSAASRLRQGEAIVRWAEMDEAELVFVLPAKGVDSGRYIPDGVVTERMASQRQATHSLLPYRLCTRDMCPAGCSPNVREAGRRIARDLAADARSAWEQASPPATARFKIASALLNAAEGDERTAYCGAAHLAASGDAFTTKKGIDVRPQVLDAIQTPWSAG